MHSEKSLYYAKIYNKKIITFKSEHDNFTFRKDQKFANESGLHFGSYCDMTKIELLKVRWNVNNIKYGCT